MKSSFMSSITIINNSGTSEVDIGTGATQIPNNTIVQNKLNTYPILSKSVGSTDPELTDNARVKSLLSEAVDLLEETDNNIIEEINLIKATPVSGKVPFILPCSENMLPGKYVNIWHDDGVSKLRLANASNGRLADGFIEKAFNIGEDATFYKFGKNDYGNLCPRGQLYLSATSPGDASIDRPADHSGFWCQEIGQCVGDNEHIFQLGFVIQLL